VKDTVFGPLIPANLQDLRNRITAAVALVEHDMLTGVWNEMDYRKDVRRITKVHKMSIYEICKNNVESFSLYGRKNYHDLLRSPFVKYF
jgi:hypothetical protein